MKERIRLQIQGGGNEFSLMGGGGSALETDTELPHLAWESLGILPEELEKDVG